MGHPLGSRGGVCLKTRPVGYLHCSGCDRCWRRRYGGVTAARGHRPAAGRPPGDRPTVRRPARGSPAADPRPGGRSPARMTFRGAPLRGTTPSVANLWWRSTP